MKPIVSFLIAAHNAEQFIERAITSARTQTITDIEIIVVDDESSDGTAEVVSRIAGEDSRVRCIRRVTNGGPSAARNDGIRIAQGDWVAILDADDVIEENRTERLLDLAEATSADIIADNLRIVPVDGNASLSVALPSGSDPYCFCVNALEYVRRNTMLAKGFKLGYLKPMLRKKVLSENGISYDETIRVGEDYLLCLRALMAGARFVVTSEPLYRYSVSSGSLSSTLKKDDICKMISAQQKYASECGNEELRQELVRSNEYLETALTFTGFVEQVKQQKLAQAAGLAIAAPRIWNHILRSGAEAAAKRLRQKLIKAGLSPA